MQLPGASLIAGLALLCGPVLGAMDVWKTDYQYWVGDEWSSFELHGLATNSQWGCGGTVVNGDPYAGDSWWAINPCRNTERYNAWWIDGHWDMYRQAANGQGQQDFIGRCWIRNMAAEAVCSAGTITGLSRRVAWCDTNWCS